MAYFALQERAALSATLWQAGPDAPTLCRGWLTRDLAAHLVLRERRPDAALGIVAAFAAPWMKQVQNRLAAGSYRDLVQRFADGPPVWNPTRLQSVDGAANTLEFYVHHEDVRRAGAAVPSRDLSAEYQRALWRSVVRLAPRALKDVRIPLRLVAPGIGVLSRGEPQVTVTGAPNELALWALGRTSAARVEIAGDEASQLALATTRLGY